MGKLFSRQQKTEEENEDDNFDTITVWGSDIDDELCGPGKICADEWTPLSSLSSTPEPTYEEVITEQPRGYHMENLVITPEPRQDEEFISNEYLHDEYTENHTTPVFVRKHRKKRQKKEKRLKNPRRKVRKINNKVHVIIDIDQKERVERVVDLDDRYREPIRVRHRRNDYQEPEHLSIVPIKHRHQRNYHHQKPIKNSTPVVLVHRTSRNPVYRHRHIPKIPAPSPYDPETAPKFIQRNRHEIIYTRVVPPNRYKGLKMEPPDPFLVRRVSNNYH